VTILDANAISEVMANITITTTLSGLRPVSAQPWQANTRKRRANRGYGFGAWSFAGQAQPADLECCGEPLRIPGQHQTAE